MARLLGLLPAPLARCVAPGLRPMQRVRELLGAMANLRQLLLRVVLATAGCVAPQATERGTHNEVETTREARDLPGFARAAMADYVGR